MLFALVELIVVAGLYMILASPYVFLASLALYALQCFLDSDG